MDLWEVHEAPPAVLSSEEDTDDEDVDPEQYLPDAKRRRLQKRRGGRRLAEVETVVISDDEGEVTVEADLPEVVNQPAAPVDPFANLLQSPELARPAPRNHSSRPIENANQQLLQQLRQQRDDFQRNSSNADADDLEEAATDFDAPRESAAAGGAPAVSEPSQPQEEAPKLTVHIQDGRGLKRKFKLRRTDAFSKLMAVVKQTLVRDGNVAPADNITFIWEDTLQPDQTPQELGWEDEEVVDIKW